MRSVLFYRDFGGFAGGHLKVWDYFCHVAASGDHEARICFSPGTLWDESNPWLALRNAAQAAWCDVRPDVYFLGGLDWNVMDAAQRDAGSVPVINLVQNVRHGWPDDPRFAFLRHRAVRICVGEEIRASIAATGRVNGPVFVIPLGLDLGPRTAPPEGAAHDIDLLIAALKQPALGAQLAQSLRRPGRRVELSDTLRPRREYLERVARARVTVFLPLEREGVYVPPLEGMALGTLVVCPDVPGTEYDRDGYNCLRPPYSAEALHDAAERALALDEGTRRRMLSNAAATVAKQDLAEERSQFLAILRNLKALW